MFQLQPQSHVKIFGDIRLRPYLLLPVFRIDERRILESRPPKKGIVAYERSHFPVSASNRNALVNPPCEVRNAVLEVVVRDLHYIW
jgi:hypothetical protein